MALELRSASIGVDTFAAVAGHCAPLRQTRKLLLSFEDRALHQLFAGFGAGTTAVRLDTHEWELDCARKHKPSLACGSGVFDVAIGCHVARRAASIDLGALFADLYRAVRAGGLLVLLAHRSDFASAPLPHGAQAHLLRRCLLDGGFDTPRFESISRESFLVVAARGASRTPWRFSVPAVAHS